MDAFDATDIREVLGVVETRIRYDYYGTTVATPVPLGKVAYASYRIVGVREN